MAATLPTDIDPAELRAAAERSKAWPFEEARRLRDRLKKTRTTDRPVVFETGYGPSGLPHIGTFGEVARTTMVRNAFHALTGGEIPTRLICVSDDMDGLRKIPENVPNPETLQEYLQKPLTVVPDPFGTHASFGAHMNARLCAFLDTFSFDYEFVSATEQYKSGNFDTMLLRALAKYDAIMDVMLPTLGEERRATYSPFLPISPKSGRVLYVPMKGVDAEAGTITFDDEDGEETTLRVTGGATKLQWKPDFGMRWAALGVDFEMFGKDHSTNAEIYSAITSILDATPPVQYVYELFLDDKGQKISKSKGNGITIDEWLTYASPESLALFMFQKPRTAKRLFFDIIPKTVDEYLTHVGKYPEQDIDAKLVNPAFHIHAGQAPAVDVPITFNLLLNLVSASNASDKDVLWGFIGLYAPSATPENAPALDRMVGYAISYFHDFVKPTKTFRAATDVERTALEHLYTALGDAPSGADGAALQQIVYDVGKAHPFDHLKDWFRALYEVLLGQSQGPRFGSFVELYGVENTRTLIKAGLDGELLADA